MNLGIDSIQYLVFGLLLILGLVIGSFIGSLTWRLPRGISVKKGRSVCPKCKKGISWNNNIPLLSFFLLRGRCRWCQKRISFRYPLIELGSTIGFVSLGYYSGVFKYLSLGTLVFLLFLLVIFSLSLVIFMIDLEYQLIFDELVFLGYLLVFLYLLLSGNGQFYLIIFAGFATSLFFLILHLVTKGRGMGLGDVKLALFLGTITIPIYTGLWVLLSFILGSIIGIFLLVFKKYGLKSKIAFGPFMVLAFWLTLFFGKFFLKYIYF